MKLLIFLVFTSVKAEFETLEDNGIDEETASLYTDRSKLFLKNAATAKFIETFKGQDRKVFNVMSETDSWYDISKLEEQNKVEFDKLCVQGVWLTYANADFQAFNKSQVSVFSGDDACADLKNHKIKSIQPVTSISSRKANTLAFFPSLNFNGAVWTFDSNHSEVSYTGRIPKSSSMIIIGPQEWTLVPVVGDPVCISPQPGKSMQFPICFIPKLKDPKSLLATTSFLQIVKGCSEETKKMQIRFCLNFDNGKIQKIDEVYHEIHGREAKNSKTTTPPPMIIIHKVKKDPKGCPVPQKFEDVIDKEGSELINIRLNYNLQSNTNFLWPKDEKKIYKLELLERTFNVAFATCPLLPIPYLQLIREIFIYLWDKESLKNDTFNEEDWRVLNTQMEECNFEIRLDDHGVGRASLVEYSQLEQEDIVKFMERMFIIKEEYDPVIEMVWLIANHAAATCHHALGFKRDYWTGFISIFEEVYLELLKGQWKSPGKLRNSYKQIFGGYGMESMHNNMGICATIALGQIRNLDPFARYIDIL